MDLSFTPEEEAFRQEVRQFLHDELPESLATKVRDGHHLTKEDHEAWHATLNRRGWLAQHWPRELGGADWSVVQRYIYDVEAALAHAPRIVPFALNMLGPVLIRFGTDEQKARWLPRILTGEDWWCQGYSEPAAGSDLASLKCAAVRDGDHYVVNGQKTWTTMAHYANMIFCLVRTDREVRPQQGISFLLIDMATPGIEVRPIRMLNGEHEVNEVFFTDVRVPTVNLVGEENAGWTCAKYLLTYERSNLAGIGHSLAALARLKALARTVRRGGRPLIEDPVFRTEIARVEIDLDNMKTTNLRALDAASHGSGGSESSMLKVRGTEIRQALTALTRRALGAAGRANVAGDEAGNFSPIPLGYETATADYFNNRKLSIFGGSNEIQREIIARSVLEL